MAGSPHEAARGPEALRLLILQKGVQEEVVVPRSREAPSQREVRIVHGGHHYFINKAKLCVSLGAMNALAVGSYTTESICSKSTRENAPRAMEPKLKSL